MSEDKQPWFKQSQCETCTETQKRIRDLEALAREMAKFLKDRITIGSDNVCCEPDGSPDEKFGLCKQCRKTYELLAKYNAMFPGDGTALLGGEGK